MKRYQSHKIVEAAQIWDTGHRFVNILPDDTLFPEEFSRGGPRQRDIASVVRVEVPAKFFERGTPQRGDYLVRYAKEAADEEQYLSWSPRAAFEAGYTLIPPATPGMSSHDAERLRSGMPVAEPPRVPRTTERDRWGVQPNFIRGSEGGRAVTFFFARLPSMEQIEGVIIPLLRE